MTSRAPGGADVAALLRSVQDQFDWPHPAEQFSVMDRWERDRSQTVFYRVSGSPGGPDLLVKVGVGWEPGRSKRTYTAMLELEGTISSGGIDGVKAVRPLGWRADPPLIVMPYIEGSDLNYELRRPGDGRWIEGQDDLRPWLEKAGAILGIYHTATVATDQMREMGPAADEVLGMARRVMVSKARAVDLVAGMSGRTRIAGCFGDFGPGNMRCAADGLYMLDPPDQLRTSPIHRDIANFLFESRRQLAGRGQSRGRPIRRRYPAVRSSFLRGYALAWSGERLAADDDALIALFETRRALGMSRKRWPRWWRDSLWFGGLALVRRSEVTRR